MSVVIQLPRDINKLCRTCMKVADEDKESFENKIISNNQLTELSKMLENVTSLKVGVNDGLPETLCEQCSEYVNVAYLFKSHCHSIDKDLRELISISDGKGLDECLTNNDCEFSCQVCMKGFNSNYQLSMHLIEHNKSSSLSERFKDAHHEIDPAIAKPDVSIYTEIIERKLYSLDGGNEITSQVTPESEFESQDDDSEVETTPIPECDACGTLFSNVAELKSHNCQLLQENSTEKPVFKCPLCSKNHANMMLLSIHFLKHAFTLDISATVLFCEVCGRLFEDTDLLNAHYQEKMTCLKDNWDCAVCKIKFETEILLLRHENTHESADRNLANIGKVPCMLCDESFLTKDTLLTHTLIHLMKKYICKECSVPFCTQQAYFQHLKCHPGYQYTCIICGLLCKTKNGLKLHVIGLHSDGPAYTCTTCNKSFKTPGRLKTHSHIHDEHKLHMCSYCGYTAHKAGDLQIHIRSHTGERPYKCTFAQCTMSFMTSSHLSGHMRRHLNIRNFVCYVCNASFGTRHSLKVHLMLHTGEKPHYCMVCGQNFRRKYHLKVHMKQHKLKA